MPLDRSRLTKDECEELRIALDIRRTILNKRMNRPGDDWVARDARWRSFVVRSLLHDLDVR